MDWEKSTGFSAEKIKSKNDVDDLRIRRLFYFWNRGLLVVIESFLSVFDALFVIHDFSIFISSPFIAIRLRHEVAAQQSLWAPAPAPALADFETSNNFLSVVLRSEWASERTNEWVQWSARAKQAVRSKQRSERCERTSKQSELPSTYFSNYGCSGPWCYGDCLMCAKRRNWCILEKNRFYRPHLQRLTSSPIFWYSKKYFQRIFTLDFYERNRKKYGSKYNKSKTPRRHESQRRAAPPFCPQ